MSKSLRKLKAHHVDWQNSPSLPNPVIFRRECNRLRTISKTSMRNSCPFFMRQCGIIQTRICPSILTRKECQIAKTYSHLLLTAMTIGYCCSVLIWQAISQSCWTRSSDFYDFSLLLHLLNITCIDEFELAYNDFMQSY